NGMGLAWLPNGELDVLDWLSAICDFWAYKGVVPFQVELNKCCAWTSAEEDQIISKLTEMDIEQQRQFGVYLRRRSELEAQLISARQKADLGVRKLLTSKGDELVVEVCNQFESLGFRTIQSDKLPGRIVKTEDIQLHYNSEEYPSFIGLVEVTGSNRGTVRHDRILRLLRYEKAYYHSTGMHPKLYIVYNGPIQIEPNNRKAPFLDDDSILSEIESNNILIMPSHTVYEYIKTNARDCLLDHMLNSTGILDKIH
ncbi:MAG: hypothetical protein ACTSWQ_10475, partial [Candidatus Thorarchaeota archaeon]